jgi:hypothetical protein
MATTRQPLSIAAHCILGDPEEMFGSPHRLFIDSGGDVSELGFYTARELRAWLRVLLRQHRLCRCAAAAGLRAYRGALRNDGTQLRFDGAPLSSPADASALIPEHIPRWLPAVYAFMAMTCVLWGWVLWRAAVWVCEQAWF